MMNDLAQDNIFEQGHQKVRTFHFVTLLPLTEATA